MYIEAANCNVQNFTDKSLSAHPVAVLPSWAFSFFDNAPTRFLSTGLLLFSIGLAVFGASSGQVKDMFVSN